MSLYRMEGVDRLDMDEAEGNQLPEKEDAGFGGRAQGSAGGIFRKEVSGW